MVVGSSIYFIPEKQKVFSNFTQCQYWFEFQDIQKIENSIQKAVLILSTRESLNKPLLIDFNGNENKQLNFDYDDGVTVYGGCGASLHGVFWYFGGRYSSDKRQVNFQILIKMSW